MVFSYRFFCEALLSVTYNDMLASCDGSMVLAYAVDEKTDEDLDHREQFILAAAKVAYYNNTGRW
jgi:hypothetical protein